MRTPEQRGRYGRWLVAAREARGWDTAQKARDALAAAGIRIGTSAYAEYESGSKVPSRNHLPKLVEFWGPVPDDDAARDSDLVAAINAQTAAISALVDRLDTFVGPLGEMVADLLRDEIRAAKDRRPSTAATS